MSSESGREKKHKKKKKVLKKSQASKNLRESCKSLLSRVNSTETFSRAPTNLEKWSDLEEIKKETRKAAELEKQKRNEQVSFLVTRLKMAINDARMNSTVEESFNETTLSTHFPLTIVRRALVDLAELGYRGEVFAAAGPRPYTLQIILQDQEESSGSRTPSPRTPKTLKARSLSEERQKSPRSPRTPRIQSNRRLSRCLQNDDGRGSKLTFSSPLSDIQTLHSSDTPPEILGYIINGIDEALITG